MYSLINKLQKKSAVPLKSTTLLSPYKQTKGIEGARVTSFRPQDVGFEFLADRRSSGPSALHPCLPAKFKFDSSIFKSVNKTSLVTSIQIEINQFHL